MRSLEMTMPPKTGIAPPDRPLPAPYGVTGMSSALASFMISAISCAVRGATTTSGMCAYCSTGVSSWENDSIFSSLVTTWRAPTIAASCSTISGVTLL